MSKGTNGALTREQEAHLGARSHLGDRDARDALVVANLGLANAIARRFRGRGIPAEDLRQEAYLSLIQAAAQFDPVTYPRVKFSTFAGLLVVRHLNDLFKERAQEVPTERLEPQHLVDQAAEPDPAFAQVEDVWAAISTVTVERRELVIQYFGLDGRPAATLRQLAERRHVSHETVRIQLQLVAGEIAAELRRTA